MVREMSAKLPNARDEGPLRVRMGQDQIRSNRTTFSTW